MTSKRFLTLVMALIAITWGVDQTFSADKPKPKKLQQITPADRKAAAKRAAQKGLKPGVAGRAARATAVRSRPRRAQPGLARRGASPGHRRSGRDPALLRPLRELGLQPAAQGPRR